MHSAEIDVDLKRSERDREAVMADIRAQLSVLPASVAIGQPISHRLDHLLSGVRAQIALKIYRRRHRHAARPGRADCAAAGGVPGLVDLTVEKQVLIPQITVRIDHRKAAQAGLTPGEAMRALQALTDGAHGAQIVDGARRYELVLRLPDDAAQPAGPGAHA